ncbi:MAG: protein-L-isoaspartate(D-aspartate) O-methyltransferase [Pseudomonadota bacterium]|nr:protein-L-isoaspartate(D-aspartate) O-methyltransferase [Pseudomonadota bacterium]
MSVNFKKFSGLGMTSDKTRERLVLRLQSKGISNPSVLDALNKVPRHIFVDEGIANKAYDDTALPIGKYQTISQPYIVARMTEILLEHKPKKVLEIGTGSGYQAVILSILVDKVYTVERIKFLHKRSISIFNKLLIKNIYSKLCDGNMGWPEKGLFDAIIITAATDRFPVNLLQQLSDKNGIILGPIKNGSEQILKSIIKSNGETREQTYEMVNFVPLLNGID